MATIIRYVNTASSGGDGTTNGTSGGTAAFASLSAAEAALRQDLTSVTCDVNDEQGNATIALDILCTGSSADTSTVDFSSASWVTDATHRVRVRLNGTGAGAKWDSSLYRIVASRSGNNGIILVSTAINITFQDLQIENTVAHSSQACGYRLDDALWDVKIIGGFVRTTGSTASPSAWSQGISVSSADRALKFYARNLTVAMGAGRGILWGAINDAGLVCYIYNCTFVNRSGTDTVFSVSGGSGVGSHRIKNLVVQGSGTSNMAGSSWDESLTNLTQDTTGSSGLQSKTLTFVDATNWDYHLASGDADAIGVGTDLSGDTYWPFSTDGDGGTRSAPWDVGADEYGSPATGTFFYLLNSAASSSNHGSLQVGGSAPSTSTTGTGWTVDTVGSSNYARMAYATERASGTFSGTAQPSSGPDNTLGDCWRSATALSGDFATGVWTIAIPVIAVTAAAGQDGRVRVRLWRSTNADGSSATEITSGAVAGTTVTDLTTGAEQVSTVTTSSITGFTMTNEYLFVQVAWEITGAAS